MPHNADNARTPGPHICKDEHAASRRIRLRDYALCPVLETNFRLLKRARSGRSVTRTILAQVPSRKRGAAFRRERVLLPGNRITAGERPGKRQRDILRSGSNLGSHKPEFSALLS